MTDKKMIAVWNSKAWKLMEPRSSLPVPFGVLMGEALDVLRFSQRNWQTLKSDEGQTLRPGLEMALGNGALSAATNDELMEIYDATQAAQTAYQLAAKIAETAPVERATFVLSEIRATLEWCFDDGQLTSGDAQFENLTTTHEGAQSHDAIAAALFDYAALAEEHQSKLEGMGGFELSLIDEARDLAQSLRERSAGPPTPQGEREALELRNRLASLLYDRMITLRAAARFVFRRHPELVRQVGSAYGRRQRANYRRRQAAEGDAIAISSSKELAQ